MKFLRDREKESPIFLYHKFLFNWHCKNFYPIKSKLSEEELNYLDICFKLPEGFQEISETGNPHYSYYTFSHRVKNSFVNSSRFAYGTVKNSEEALNAALPVFNRRKIQIDPYFLKNSHVRFGGLGWDLIEEYFKVYFRMLQFDDLPQPHLRKMLNEIRCDYSKEGIISFTYKQKNLFEEKIYVHPLKTKDNQLIDGTYKQTLMFSSKRGFISQFDVYNQKKIKQQINNIGKKIIRKYHRIGEKLDTIIINNYNDYTLYFP